MTLKISDLVRSALDLADLNNSSMPTVAENMFWINTAFSRVYQKAINMGEKYYFTETTVDAGDLNEDDTLTLPSGFYQLFDIRKNNHPIRRYQKWMTEHDTYYDIRGTKLVTNKVDTPYIIQYFNNPIEMNITNEDTQLDFPNHIFYQLCSIYLAEYYKIKQGADVSALKMMEQEAWNTYYDVLTRDINQPLVIQDAYRHADFINGTSGVGF